MTHSTTRTVSEQWRAREGQLASVRVDQAKERDERVVHGEKVVRGHEHGRNCDAHVARPYRPESVSG